MCRTHYLREKSYTQATMLFVGLNLFYCNVKLTYVRYNFSVLQVLKLSSSYLIVLKIPLIMTKLQKDHTLATDACISVYKTEKGFNSKGKYAKR